MLFELSVRREAEASVAPRHWNALVFLWLYRPLFSVSVRIQKKMKEEFRKRQGMIESVVGRNRVCFQMLFRFCFCSKDIFSLWVPWKAYIKRDMYRRAMFICQNIDQNVLSLVAKSGVYIFRAQHRMAIVGFVIDFREFLTQWWMRLIQVWFCNLFKSHNSD